jgi:tRNA (guanine26-N2/guanine27-N2)-dimethyltransferase
MSATGLRGVRYSKELSPEFVRECIANDMDEKAVECILNNAKINEIDMTKFKISKSECSKLLYQNIGKYEIIDLDPYGSAMPLIDSAIQSVKNKGMLCVTFTDMPVLCGNYPETTFYKYGSIPYKTSYCHEVILILF